MSCPKELTSRRTRWRYSVVISLLPVRSVQRKASSSGGRLTAFSHSSEGFGGHDISVLFERTSSRMSRPVCCISLTLDGVSLLSNCWDNVTTSLASWTFERFWEERIAYYCSGDLQIATSRRILSLTFFGYKFFFCCWFGYFSSAHGSHVDHLLLSQINHLIKPGIY